MMKTVDGLVWMMSLFVVEENDVQNMMFGVASWSRLVELV